MKILSCGSRVYPCGRTKLTKLIVAFHNFTNAGRNTSEEHLIHANPRTRHKLPTRDGLTHVHRSSAPPPHTAVVPVGELGTVSRYYSATSLSVMWWRSSRSGLVSVTTDKRQVDRQRHIRSFPETVELGGRTRVEGRYTDKRQTCATWSGWEGGGPRPYLSTWNSVHWNTSQRNARRKTPGVCPIRHWP